LALPISAPWASVVTIGNFAKNIKPEIAIPIHDGYMIEYATRRQHNNFEKYLSENNIGFKNPTFQESPLSV